MTKIRVIALAVATAITAAITFVPATSTADQRATRDSDFQRVRIHGHPAEHPNWTVRGHMNVRRFVFRNGEVRAVAKITDAVVRRANGDVVRRLNDPQRAVFRVTLPSSGGASTAGNDVSIAATCRILDLVLGPLDLDLLDLKVHLNRVCSISSPRAVPEICWGTCCARSQDSSTAYRRCWTCWTRSSTC
jgi:hypothetical protein